MVPVGTNSNRRIRQISDEYFCEVVNCFIVRSILSVGLINGNMAGIKKPPLPRRDASVFPLKPIKKK